AHEAARHFTFIDDLVHDAARHVGGDRETDALVPAGLARQDGRVDTNQLAVRVDQRPARVAAVNRGVGLDEILEAFDLAAEATSGGTDDAHGDRTAQAERLPDRERHIANLNVR